MIDLNKTSSRQYDKIFELIERWRQAKGRGSFVNIFDKHKLTEIIIDKLIIANKDVNITIISDTNWITIRDNIKYTYYEPETILHFKYNIKLVIKSDNVNTAYLLIIDNLNLLTLDEIDTILSMYEVKTLYILGFINDMIKQGDEKKYIKMPPLNIIKHIDSNQQHEYYIGLTLNKNEQELHDFHDNHLKQIMSKFSNNYKLIQSFIDGKPKEMLSASDCRYEFAKSMGWERGLDLTIPYNQEIENLYNPNSIYDAIRNYYDITRIRNAILDFSVSKLNMCDNIIKQCKTKHKRFILLSNNSELALTLWSLHNDCGIFCNQTPTIERDGKKYGKELLKTESIKKFKNGDIPGIITANTLDTKFNVCNVDVVIYSNPNIECASSLNKSGKVTQFDITTTNISFWLYIVGTKQETKIKELADQSNIAQTFATSGFQLSL